MNNDAPKCAGDKFDFDDHTLDKYNLENKTVFLDAKAGSFFWDKIVRYIFDVFLMILMIVENKEF